MTDRNVPFKPEVATATTTTSKTAPSAAVVQKSNDRGVAVVESKTFAGPLRRQLIPQYDVLLINRKDDKDHKVFTVGARSTQAARSAAENSNPGWAAKTARLKE